MRLASESSWLTSWKRSSSYSPRTKALMARMPVSPSWMRLFRRSMAACWRLYRGLTLRTIRARMSPRTGVQITKTRASLAFMAKDSPMPSRSITGPRTMGRRPPLMAFCITVTSVVIRVTRDEEENRSRLEKAKLWSFSYSASRSPPPKR